MQARQVTAHFYFGALTQARRASKLVAGATSKPAEMPKGARYFLADDLMSGFGIDGDGTLIGVFSLIKGRGEGMVTHAIKSGARKLDCFDGFLPGYYERFGFVETERVPNWTQGEPDVVFMALA
ncbi:hypothetical protein ABZ348_31055 [Streptomyces sp. NPDC005963]|uniref:hypothetical protein n=1 Tax=Streptomyces sp. NPDC005963 TaxID=3156721 RepID=UPI0033DA40CC